MDFLGAVFALSNGAGKEREKIHKEENLAGGALNGLLEAVPEGGPTQLDASSAN